MYEVEVSVSPKFGFHVNLLFSACNCDPALIDKPDWKVLSTLVQKSNACWPGTSDDLVRGVGCSYTFCKHREAVSRFDKLETSY